MLRFLVFDLVSCYLADYFCKLIGMSYLLLLPPLALPVLAFFLVFLVFCFVFFSLSSLSLQASELSSLEAELIALRRENEKSQARIRDLEKRSAFLVFSSIELVFGVHSCVRADVRDCAHQLLHFICFTDNLNTCSSS